MSYPYFMMLPPKGELIKKCRDNNLFPRQRYWINVKREEFFVINLEFFNSIFGTNYSQEDFKYENANRMRYCVEKVLKDEYDATEVKIHSVSVEGKLYRSKKDGKYYFYTMQRFKRSRAIRDVDFEKFFVVRIYSFKPEYIDIMDSQTEFKFYMNQNTCTIDFGFSYEKNGRTYYSNFKFKNGIRD